MRIFNKIILTVTLLIGVGSVCIAASQDTVFNYFCDFEDAAVCSQWTILAGDEAPTIPNKWVIDTAVNNGGEYSLYVSPDSGRTASYLGSSCVILAYTDLILRKTGSDYQLSFDWISNGDKEGGIDGLYVAFVPETDWEGNPISLKSVKNSTLDADLKAYCLELNPSAIEADERLVLKGKSTWQTITVPISKGRTGTKYRLVFIWRNGNIVGNPGACIDNIVILDGRACAKPQNFNISTTGNDSLNLSWEGDASRYEVGCYSYEKDEWFVNTVYDTTGFTYTDIPEGFCDFYVRTICYDSINQVDYYSGKMMANRFIYYPNNHCIDYITLTDDNCYYTEKNAFSDTRDNITYLKGMLDFGSDAKESRHTHYYSKTETDPRTGGGLKVVPDGEIASVRLGNWDTGAQSERAEFNFYVDTAVNPILIMKYAVVLENPGHDVGATTKSDPRFKLEVLRNGKSIGDCSSADFTSSQGGDGWKEFKPSSGTTIVWRDWTTIGVNLGQYHGETLKIRVTTYDCGWSGHYGYAYFTMGCDRAQLNAETCDGTPQTEFRAPAGFQYEWYRVDEPEKILSTEQTFVLQDTLDTRQYAVNVIFKEKDKCSFTLYTAIPRYPVADYDYTISRRDCKNYVTFFNKSEVRQNDYYHHDTIRSQCDSVRWNMGPYTQLINPTQFQPGEVEFPISGDTFQVSVHAFVGNCEDIKSSVIYLKKIGTTYVDTIVQGCKGYPYIYHGINGDGTPYVSPTRSESGVYNDTLISSIRCDSIIVTHLTLYDTLFSYLDTLIRSDAYFVFKGDTLRTEGTYVDYTTSIYGCDSISTLHLRVHKILIVDLPERDSSTLCAGDNDWVVPFTVKQGETQHFSLQWVSKDLPTISHEAIGYAPLKISMPNRIQPDIYKGMFIFHDSIAQIDKTIPDDTVAFKLYVLYPDTVITQRWNDVLAIRNADYNGGFKLVAYQWYKNGQVMPGDTLSYIYKPEGLDVNAEYSALVTRAGDNLKLMICPPEVQKIDKNKTPDIPTLVRVNQPMPIRLGAQTATNGTATWISMTGTVVSRQSYIEGNGVVSPEQIGIYLLTLTSNEDGNRSTYTIVVQ